MSTDPALAAVPPEAWHELWRALDAVIATPLEELAQWRGGERTTSTDSAGVERSVIQMPYVDYGPAVLDLTRAVSSVASSAGVTSGPALAAPSSDGPLETLQWAFRIIRGDRFVEGLLASRLGDGSLVDALTRLRAWHRTEA